QMSRTLKIAIAAFAIAMVSAPAALTEPAGIEVVSVRVPYGDLDMSKAAGGATLLKRIEGAARKGCGKTTGRSPLQPRWAMTCRSDAIGAAVRSAGIDTLTLAWSGKHPATTLASR